jgi:UPF0755 protein
VKLQRLALGALAAASVVGVGLASHLYRLLQAPSPGAPVQTFVVARGSTMADVARDLEAAGLVRSAAATELWGRLTRAADDLKAGEYELTASWPVEDILERLVRGQVKTHEVVVPEGLRASEIAARLEEAGLVDAEDFLAVVHDASFARALGVEGDSLEGYLFPETYRFQRGLPARQLARTFVEHFLEVWEEIAPLAAERGMSMREVVTLASIVEKETGAAEERPLIAAVFQNRLARGMRLETDPAVIYGIEDFDGNLRRVHLEDASNPYNTYRIRGLPPGPIASPGEDALRAVVQPAETDYLYFVSRNDGTHHFSRTYREHVNAVNRYQRRRSR